MAFATQTNPLPRPGTPPTISLRLSGPKPHRKPKRRLAQPLASHSNPLTRHQIHKRPREPLACDMLHPAVMLISGPTRIVFAILLFACTLATLAKAQAPLPAGVPAKPEELTLADLGAIRVDTVNGASQFVQQVIEAPSSVTIITADQIQKHGYRTMA